MTHAASRLPDEIKAKLTVSQAATTLLGVPLKRQGREQVCLCPFHDEKTPSFSINDEKGVFLCRGCGANGDVISLVAQYKGIENGEAITWLADHLGIDRPVYAPRATSSSTSSSAPDARQRIDQGYALLALAKTHFENQKSAKEFQSFVARRSFPDELVAQYEVGYCPEMTDDDWMVAIGAHGHQYQGVPLPQSAHLIKRLLEDVGLMVYRNGRRHAFFRNRVVFPIHDVKGRVCGFAGRTVEHNGVPKYLNSPDSSWFAKSGQFYGAYPGRHIDARHNPFWRDRRQVERVYVVEGYTDVMRLAEHGHWAVAPMGTAITAEHVKWLTRLGMPFTFVFDGDAAGAKASGRAIRNLWGEWSDTLSASVATIPDGMDPDEWLGGGAGAMEDVPQADYLDALLGLSDWSDAHPDAGASTQIRVWNRFLAFLSENGGASSMAVAYLKESMLSRLPAVPGQGDRHRFCGDELEPSVPGGVELLGALRAHPELSVSLSDLSSQDDLAWSLATPRYADLSCLIAAASVPYDHHADHGWADWAARVSRQSGLPATLVRQWGYLSPGERMSEQQVSEVVQTYKALIAHLRLAPLWRTL